MARDIDLTKPLSEKDRDYLLARGREQQVFANDAKFSNDPEAVKRALYIPGTAIDLAEGVPDTPNADEVEVQGGGDNDPDADPGLDDGETEDNYETWTHDKLQEEIRNRNSRYSDEFQMPVSGTKAELVARLREDDQDDE